MKATTHVLFSIIGLSIFLSCGSTLEFPVSDIVPAARITAKITTDKYGNTIIEMETRYLVSPERLNPPRKIYVVWASTETMGLVNLGKLYSESADKGSLRTLTPFTPEYLFITAEETAMIRRPRGVEIARLDL